MKVSVAFRRYHRQVALIMTLPLALTVITGIAYPISDHWLKLGDVSTLILEIHSGQIFGMQFIYPILNGLGLAGLLITGISMTSLFRNNRSTNKSILSSNDESPKR